MVKRYIILTIVCLALLFMFLLRPRLASVESPSRVIMGTIANIKVIAEDADIAQACIDAAFDTLEQIEKKMSYRLPGSEVSEINQNAFQKPVKVSKQTFDLLAKSIEYSKLTDGAFDITVGPLIQLWKKAEKENRIPSDDQIAQVEKSLGFEKLILDPNNLTVRFAAENMKLDLGAIAKGYAIDQAIEVIKARGAAGAMVDVGGDIRCFGQAPNNQKSWRIGLQNPQLDDDKPLMVLKLKDQSVTTSGDYRRFATIQGQKFSHIIDRTSGKSADSLASVTIIAPTAAHADALATALSVLGKEKGLALIETIPNTECLLIDHLQNITKSSGIQKFL